MRGVLLLEKTNIMRPILALLIINILCCGVLLAQETDLQVMPSAFGSILQRVKERDSDTGAIKSVFACSDAPSADLVYSIAIKAIPRTSDVVIELRGIADPKIVYESYRLRASPAINSEIDKIKAASRSTKRTEKKQDFVFLNITHLQQGKNLCAPTSASMALFYFGHPVPPERIKTLANSVTKRPDFAGTYFEDIVNGLREINAIWEEKYFKTTKEGFDSGLKEIISSLDKGYPVMVDTYVPPDGHTVLVNGYDPNRQLISIVDPLLAAPGLRQMTYIEFEIAWRSLTADIRGGIFTSPIKKQ